MSQPEEMRHLLVQHEKLNDELTTFVKNSVHSKIEHSPKVVKAAPDSLTKFYKEKIDFFQNDNLKLLTLIESKKRKMVDMDTKLETASANLEQKQESFRELQHATDAAESQFEQLTAQLHQHESSLQQLGEQLCGNRQQEQPLKTLIDQHISQIVNKKSAVALLESQRALQSNQFAQAKTRSQILVERLARVQSENAEAQRELTVTSAQRTALEALQAKARQQDALRSQRGELAAFYSDLIKEKTDYVERYKEMIKSAHDPVCNASTVFEKADRLAQTITDHLASG